VKKLRTILHPVPAQRLKIFTDGSTQMKGRKSENSGFGIVVMDEKGQTLYEGGGIVRSDGNNFIPEIAAAAITLHALPNHLQADIFIDNQATISAIKEKPLSERRRIRASGRAWKNFIRKAVAEKSQLVQIHHIKAHEGDNADKIAKEFMAEAEEMKPAPYFTAYEEEIVLFHEDTLIEGDIRTWLKKHEIEKALNDWKAQPVAGKLIRKFPKQVPILAKEIWKSAIQWLGFILSLRYATDYRLIYKNTSF
jgi:ribonuclease HI